MQKHYKLGVGDMSANGQIIVVDEDRLCYIVRSESRGSVGLRTISKAILAEFVGYAEKHSESTPRDARNALSGTSQIDKYEYGYESTILTMAKMVLGQVEMSKMKDDISIVNTIIFGPTKYGSNTLGYPAFLKEVILTILKDDPSLSRLTQNESNYDVKELTFSVGGCIIGRKYSHLSNLRMDNYDIDVVWEFQKEKYALNKELSGEAILNFTNLFNLVYANEYVIDYKLDDRNKYVFTLYSCKKDKVHIVNSNYRSYITAIKSKPFLLLAGISGTGKSRIVRELARACWEEGSEEYKAQKPKNFEMIQVKPNWHDSSELIGYVSRIDGEKFVVGPFLKFIAKAIQNPDVPYFLCLDEMNLAPVEQYFAEYLSVIESRKWDNGEIVTDPIIDYEPTDAYKSLIDQLFYDDETRKKYLTKENGERLGIPQNLIVVGTVNMDETTFSFSRKVLDRAMTIEMNEVDLEGGLDKKYESIGKLGAAELIGNAVEGVDVYADNKGVCDRVINYLKAINGELEGTPFKVAYRTRNEFLLYVVNNLPYNKDENGEDIAQEVVMARALDEITSMKILSRIEGDTEKIGDLLDRLKEVIKKQLNEISSGKEYSGTKDEEGTECSVSLAKLKEMKLRLKSGYTSFWS